MAKSFTLEYWLEDSWYIDRLQEIRGVFWQGETPDELEETIRDVYVVMLEEDTPSHLGLK